ncbi:MAG: DUF2442 domain-containing protein [Dissulfurispiraceae bacterium]
MSKRLPDLSFLAPPLIAVSFVLLLIFCARVKSVYAEVWGDSHVGIYPFKSSIVAPNGLLYNPLAHIGLSLNIGSDNIYIFDENTLFLAKPDPGLTTNSSQGSFDFTKREVDFKIGLAAKPFDNKHLEFRLWEYALNNLNRGNDPNRPSGFNDGLAAETRYYFIGEKAWGYLNGGYYFTKELMAPNGVAFKPGIFAGGELNYNLLEAPGKLYAFSDVTVVNLFGRFELGVAYRPLLSLPDTEVRLSGSRYLDLNEKSPTENTVMFEIRHYFGSHTTVDNIKSAIATKAVANKSLPSPVASVSTAVKSIPPPSEAMATDVWSDSLMLHVKLVDGREIGVPLEWFPKLLDANDIQRKKWRLTGNGTGIHWDNLNEEVSVKQLLKG